VRILVAEDDAITRRLLQANLGKWGHDVLVCADGTKAWEILNGENPPRIVILDWMMPGMDGVTICREIRKSDHQPYIYIILLTAKTSKEDVVEGLEAGADDYVIKPFDTHELRVRVRAGSRIISLQEDLMSALVASEFQATHDALTGLWNRKAILDILKKELARSQRDGSPIGVIVADLDHFKSVNDTHGHLAGDAVLGEVAEKMTNSMRPYDSLGRYGGEEFMMVVPGCDSNTSREVAERLRSMLSQSPLVTREGTFHVTMSFGVASCHQHREWDESSVIRAADRALYRAKEMGRNRVEEWSEADSQDDNI